MAQTLDQTAAAQPPREGEGLASFIRSRMVILVPYLWLLVFFLIPFAIVFKISLSQSAISMPPYAPTFDVSAGFSGLLDNLRELSFDNYLWLLDDK